MKLLFYNAYIVPVLDYCCSVWGHCNKTALKKINSMQSRAIYIILKSTGDASDFLHNNKWMTFADRCSYQIAVLIFNSKQNNAPKYISDILTFSNSNYLLRSVTHNDLVFNDKPRTNYLLQYMKSNFTKK